MTRMEKVGDSYNMGTALRHLDRALRVMRGVQARRIAAGTTTSDVDGAIRAAMQARYDASMAAINYEIEVPQEGGGSR
jgi:hypothetical protein